MIADRHKPDPPSQLRTLWPDVEFIRDRLPENLRYARRKLLECAITGTQGRLNAKPSKHAGVVLIEVDGRQTAVVLPNSALSMVRPLGSEIAEAEKLLGIRHDSNGGGKKKPPYRNGNGRRRGGAPMP